ncbi:MAG TPA: hypothetical protein VER17_18015 [Tepidisphaeraceae bacterium]|nr:hypothetical protein [Tepidisphaeraceae bacterium]
MITSGRRPNRPDGQVYRQMRRQGIAGRSLLEWGRRGGGGGGRRRRGSILHGAAWPLRVLLKLFR